MSCGYSRLGCYKNKAGLHMCNLPVTSDGKHAGKHHYCKNCRTHFI